MNTAWESIKKNFPWHDAVLGYMIPKAIFLVGISRNMLFTGGIVAVAWCLAVFWFTRVRTYRVNIFAVFAVAMIMARIAVVLVSKSPTLYLFAQALDNAIFALIFIVSLFWPRSVIQIFAEESGAKIPEAVRSSVYYARAWRIITAVWGIVFLLMALVLAVLNLQSLKVVAIIDICSGWPASIILIAFTFWFPKWYWTKKLGALPL